MLLQIPLKRSLIDGLPHRASHPRGSLRLRAVYRSMCCRRKKMLESMAKNLKMPATYRRVNETTY